MRPAASGSSPTALRTCAGVCAHQPKSVAISRRERESRLSRTAFLLRQTTFVPRRPVAKLATQRLRRLRGRNSARADGVLAVEGDGKFAFDPLHISPGTQFSEELSVALRGWAERRVAEAARAGKARFEVVLSDAAVPGEGELKCMEYLDALRDDADVVVFGGDADLARDGDKKEERNTKRRKKRRLILARASARRR